MSSLSNQKVIGLTGTIGSGKSTVAQWIAQSYPMVDCDQINAKLLEKGEDGYKQLVKLPWIVLDENQNIDKKKMAQAIFSDLEKKKRVESILHPLILKKVEEWVSNHKEPLLFVEMPVLFEAHAESMFDSIWCICTSEEKAIDRLVHDRHFETEDAHRRIKNQWNVHLKKAKSNYIVENDGTLEDLRKKVEDTIRKEEESV